MRLYPPNALPKLLPDSRRWLWRKTASAGFRSAVSSGMAKVRFTLTHGFLSGEVRIGVQGNFRFAVEVCEAGGS